MTWVQFVEEPTWWSKKASQQIS